jgi:hypothetical protein
MCFKNYAIFMSAIVCDYMFENISISLYGHAAYFNSVYHR